MSELRFKEPPNEALCEIGALVVTAAAIDNHVGVQLLRMISPIHFVSWHEWPLVSGMDFKVKLNLIRTYAAMSGHEERAYISECCDKLQKLYQKRNSIAHSVFQGQTKNGRLMFQDLRADGQTGGTRPKLIVTVDTLRSWGAEMLQWTMELERSLNELGYPVEAPTLDDVGDRLPPQVMVEPETLAQVPRTKRRKPKPSPR